MLLFSSQQSCEVEWVPLEMGSWGTLCDLLMAAQLPKELTWNSCWSVGSRLGQSFYYHTMHVPSAKELFHIVLNWVGLCVIIVVTCNGKTTFLFYRYNRLTLLRYISRVKPTSLLSCFVTASIRWAHTIASLHFDRVMDAVYCSFSLQWMKTAWTSTVFRMTNIPLRPQDTRWCSTHAQRDCLHITHLHRFFSNKASYQCSHFQNKSCEILSLLNMLYFLWENQGRKIIMSVPNFHFKGKHRHLKYFPKSYWLLFFSTEIFLSSLQNSWPTRFCI